MKANVSLRILPTHYWFIGGLIFILLLSVAVLPNGIDAGTQVILDWETDANGTPLQQGQIIDDEFHSTSGVSVTITVSGGTNTATIFDSNTPTGGDPDLGTPNETCAAGAPGIGDGGEVGTPGENCTAQDNLLIVAENVTDSNNDGLIDDPDDAIGGQLSLVFSEAVNLDYIEIIDQEDTEQVTINAYADVDGTILIASENPTGFGNNSYEKIGINALAAQRLDFDFTGSGGIASVAYTTLDLDLGDLPASYNNTVKAEDGARHVVGDLQLGQTIDIETDGQESNFANGDDSGDSDDEDGVTRVPGLSGSTSNDGWTEGNVADQEGGCLEIVITGGSGVPQVFMDFSGSNTLTEVTLYDTSGNPISTPLPAGIHTLCFDIPAGTFDGVSDTPIAARVRLSSEGGLSATGLALDGEIEDYIWTFGPTTVALTDITITGSRPVNTSLQLAGVFAGTILITALIARRRRTHV